MGYKFRGTEIPEYMMDALTRYIEKGIPPGDFLTAVLTNDLYEAISRSDDTNLHCIPAYVGYLYNEAPSQCWGSKAKMDKWIDDKIADRVAERNAQAKDYQYPSKRQRINAHKKTKKEQWDKPRQQPRGDK